MVKHTSFHRIIACFLCISLFLCFSSCEKEPEEDGTGITLNFSETNTRGNTNGNIANLGMGAKQGEWIIFTDLGDGGTLKASKNGGKHCITLMSHLNDIFACINLTGQRLDYISSLYGDINTVWLEDQTASSLIATSSYCMQAVDSRYYYIDEGGDGGIYKMDPDSAEPVRVGTHAAYIQDVTTESSHASFSVDGGYLYYCAADDDLRIYRVDLETNEEVMLCSRSASMLIVQDGRVMFIDADNRRLYSLDEDGTAEALTQCSVGTFNFDGSHIFYTDTSRSGKPVMRMSLAGNGAAKLCDAEDTMYITLLDDLVMLYCVNDEGSNARNLFVDRSGGETYSPG